MPLHLSPSGCYLENIKYASSKFVVLYDVNDRRAWLVNGASALLHLVRASLEDDLRSVIGSKILFRSEQLQEAGAKYTTSFAAEVLINEENMELPILPHKRDLSEETASGAYDSPGRSGKIKRTHLLFQDRVEHVYHILEQGLEYQVKREAAPGVELKFKRHKCLEGFDFADMAARTGSVALKVNDVQPT